MENKESDRHGAASPASVPGDLVDRLRRLPDIDPPPALSNRIMEALTPRRRPWWQAFIFRLSRPQSFTFTPIKWVPLGALAVILIIGFGLDLMPGGRAPSLHQETTRSAGETETRYRTGRRLLADGNSHEALDHLKYAADSQPDNALYQFWLGVGYWSIEDSDQERMHYQAALQNDPEFLPAHVYIGHNYLDRGDWQMALQHYLHVLQVVPDHAGALFNKGIALYKLGDVKRENDAWRAYLQAYDRGEPALQAVERLNANGDFSYRRLQLGPLNFVKPAIVFEDGGTRLDASAQVPLDEIGRVVAHNRKLELHVLAYVANDTDAAEKRAKAIKRYLTDHFVGIAPQRIKPSWFGVSEKVQHDKRIYELASSIRLFASIVDES